MNFLASLTIVALYATLFVDTLGQGKDQIASEFLFAWIITYATLDFLRWFARKIDINGSVKREI